MQQPFETIIVSEIPYENGRIKVTIDHLLDVQDDDDVYTGCYRATLGNGKIVNVELNAERIWIETGNGSTAISKAIGELIDNYTE